MRVRLLLVPYDSGHHEVRMGRGPGQLAGPLAAALEADGHQPTVETIAAPAGFATEAGTSFALYRELAGRVVAARGAGAFPLVVAGNCGSALGTCAGAGAEAADLAVAWFDSHGDFNTPESSETGFLDGMALAILTGRCWRPLAARIPGFAPLAERRALLLGARDFDLEEHAALVRSEVGLVEPEALRGAVAAAALAAPLRRLAAVATRLYLHLDLDVIDPAEARANQFAAPGGPTSAEVANAIDALGEALPIAAAALTAYDPAYDQDGRMLAAAVGLGRRVVSAAARRG